MDSGKRGARRARNAVVDGDAIVGGTGELDASVRCLVDDLTCAPDTGSVPGRRLRDALDVHLRSSDG